MAIKKLFFLSPHQDDIAFSLGGMLHLKLFSLSTNILVNIFNHSNYCLPSAKVICISRQRNLEDNEFAEFLNLDKINLDLEDSSLLGHTARSEIICSTNDLRYLPLNRKLVNITDQKKPYRIFCPLGLGGHIDHRMVREVCMEIFKKRMFSLIFYEDLPYAHNYRPQEIESIIKHTIGYKLYAHYIEITDKWDMKEKGMSFYKSQLTQECVIKIKDYARSLGTNNLLFERIWLPRQC